MVLGLRYCSSRGSPFLRKFGVHGDVQYLLIYDKVEAGQRNAQFHLMKFSAPSTCSKRRIVPSRAIQIWKTWPHKGGGVATDRAVPTLRLVIQRSRGNSVNDVAAEVAAGLAGLAKGANRGGTQRQACVRWRTEQPRGGVVREGNGAATGAAEFAENEFLDEGGGQSIRAGQGGAATDSRAGQGRARAAWSSI
ncbi:hypothetical protein AXG93_1335s1070 [Marchantia polymorpha subsp. ruderalis]|uniref:Uncharacterized protein n=1 Tax=Marchantia polymorpha subsp. ruderalis TaxID=1480154 RepID=A0A176W8X1_MARPO|nr:hypothetical protein AXG93_1335s1070 [Marchantia polymorpha subsp. ruderalis]